MYQEKNKKYLTKLKHTKKGQTNKNVYLFNNLMEEQMDLLVENGDILKNKDNISLSERLTNKLLNTVNTLAGEENTKDKVTNEKLVDEIFSGLLDKRRFNANINKLSGDNKDGVIALEELEKVGCF